MSKQSTGGGRIARAIVQQAENGFLIKAIDPLTDQPVGPPDPADTRIVADTLRDVRTFVSIPADIEVLIDSNYFPGGEDGFLSHLMRDHVTGVIGFAVNPDAIRKVVTNPNLSDARYAEWYDSPRTYESLLARTVAHEAGHYWYNERSVLSDSQHTETNSTLLKWGDFAKRNMTALSKGAQLNVSITEGFADAFASYTTSHDLAPLTRQCMRDNLK